MGLNHSVNILTSGFLVSVVVFFVLMGYFLYEAYNKIGQVLEKGDSKRNDLQKINSTLNYLKTAYVLAFIAAGMSLLLAVLYAGHESVISPSEYWHLALYVITYALLIISVIYAFMALNRLYDLGIEDRNGADSYIWASLFVALFGFLGLTASGSGRLGMNAARTSVQKRIGQAESNVNEHLPAIRGHIEHLRSSVEADIPAIRSQVHELHQSALMSPNVEAVSMYKSGPQLSQMAAAQMTSPQISQMNLPQSYPQMSQMSQMPAMNSMASQMMTPRLPTLTRV